MIFSPSLHYCTRRVFTLSSLTGALPHSFGKLANLIELRLGSNLFSGPLKGFVDFKNLIQLDLSGKHRVALDFYLIFAFGASHASVVTLLL